MTASSFFQAGGSLDATLPSYVIRQADKELYEHLLNGDFCYVLTARQMGKSSLKVRVMEQLQKENWQVTSIDLTAFGAKGINTDQWYYSFLYEIADALDFEDSFDDWWKSKSQLTPVARMSQFWGQVLLKETSQKIVILIDEVDTMLSLDKTLFSTDDFFASIRAAYNRRSQDEAFKRLNFAIFGVAAPQDLMTDHERTPFNIGLSIPIQNFTSEEASVLKSGFKGNEAIQKAILERILHWTDGQPFLTQRLGQLMSNMNYSHENINKIVDEVVANHFFQVDIFNTPHFNNIQTRILANDSHNFQMLDIYQNILKNGSYKGSQRSNEQLYLKLSGLVQENQGELIANNRIYTQVFDKKWLEKSYGSIKRPFTLDLQRWMNTERSPDALLVGKVLKDAEIWAQSRDDLSNNERNFLEASRLAQVEAGQEKRIQAERDRRQKQLRIALVFTALLAIISVITGIYGIQKAQEASRNEQKATDNAKLFQQEATKAQAQADTAQTRLDAYLAEQATRVIGEVDDIIERATSLKNNGYQNAAVWRNLLLEADSILKQYPENEKLMEKETQVTKLLNP